MGLIYNPQEVKEAVNELENIIKNCEDASSDLKLANDNCLSTISESLNSDAVKVFETMVTKMFVPALDSLKSALNFSKNDVKDIRTVVENAGDEYLDEDILNKQKKLYLVLESGLTSKVKNSTNVEILKSLDQKMLETYSNNINKIDEKLTLLHNLNSYTNEAFANTLSIIDTVSKAVQEMSTVNLEQKKSNGSFDVVNILSNIAENAQKLATVNLVVAKTVEEFKIHPSQSVTPDGVKIKLSSSEPIVQTESPWVKQATRLDEFFNGTGKITTSIAKGGLVKMMGIVGTALLVKDLATTFSSRTKKYGLVNGTADTLWHFNFAVAGTWLGGVAATALGAAFGWNVGFVIAGTIVIGATITGTCKVVYDSMVNRHD